MADIRKNDRRRLVAISIVCLLAVVGCGDRDKSATKSSEFAAPIFQEMAQVTGLVFKHDSGATGKYYMPEIMGAGVALLDYDGDDDLDVFVLQGRRLEPGAAEEGSDSTSQPGHRLYRNESNPSGKLQFSDVTASAGVGDRGFGMGVAVGDIDNNGDLDAVVSNTDGPMAAICLPATFACTLASVTMRRSME